MGFPIPYAGVLPRLLFTAAISMATIRDLCLSLLESFGIITSHIIHHDPDNYIVNDSARSFPDINYPSHDPYFNPHLHSPADHPLLLRRTAFFQAVQASLPAMLYESLPPIINTCLVQECPPADAMPSSPPSLSASITSLAAPAELAVPSQASNLQRPANSLGLGDSVLVNSMSYLSLSSMSCPSPSSSSSLTSCSHLSPTSSSSSSLCSSTSHVSRIPPKFEQGAQASAIAESDQSIKRIVKFEASSSHNPKTPPGGLSTAYDLQIGQQNPVMPIRPSAAWNATAEAHISQYDQLQKHWPPASTELSFPCSCGATAAISDVDRHLRQRTVTYTLETQALAMRSPISAYFAQEGAAGSSNASKYHLQQRAECAVCLCEFERGEEVRLLPSCRHIFHKDCIDGWILHNHRTCPLCRSSLLTAAIEVQEKMREQELSDQLSAWINSLEQEEGLASQDHHL